MSMTSRCKDCNFNLNGECMYSGDYGCFYDENGNP
jgi:hypothetical protein